MSKLTTIALLACFPFILGMSKLNFSKKLKKKDQVSFHLQTLESNKFGETHKVGPAQKEVRFSKSPDLDGKYIDNIYFFTPKGGAEMSAVAFKLNGTGTAKLHNLSNGNQGNLLMVKVGELKRFLQIDAQITDGVIIVWSGITSQYRAELSKIFQAKELPKAS